MTAKLQWSAQRVSLHDVGPDRDGGASKLIEQRSRSRMVVRITLLQSKNGNCVGALPSYERPILVHRTKIESTGRITVSIKGAPYRTSPLSPLPSPFSPLEERFIDIRCHHRRPLPRKLPRPLPPLLNHVV